MMKNFKNILAYLALFSFWVGAQALADWTLPTAGGPVTYDAYLTGGGLKQLPKIVMTDETGTRVGTSSNAIVNSLVAGGNALTIGSTGAASLNISQLNNATINNANPLPTKTIFGGADVIASNPLPGQLSQGNAVLANSNPLPLNPTNGSALVTTSNPLYVSPLIEPPTYNASTILAYVSSATDVLCLQGSSTKIVKIKRIGVTFLSGSNVYTKVVRRSSGNTGGSPTTITSIKSDPNDSAATATLTSYGGLPSLGTLVGILRTFMIPVGNNHNFQEWRFHAIGEKPVYLRGTSEYACINLNGDVTVASTGLYFIEWSEE